MRGDALVDVRPGLADALVLVVLKVERDRHVDAVKRDQQLSCTPDFGEGVDDALLLSDIPGDLFVP